MSIAHNCTKKDDAELAEMLLCKGADVEKVGASRATPLCIAAQKGCKAVAALLIKHKANVNRTTTEYQTPPLFVATEVRISRLDAILPPYLSLLLPLRFPYSTANGAEWTCRSGLAPSPRRR